MIIILSETMEILNFFFLKAGQKNKTERGIGNG